EAERRGPRHGFYLPLGVVVQGPRRRRPEAAHAVFINVHPRVFASRVAGIKAGHHVNPFAGSQLVLEKSTGAQASLRIEDVRRDAIGPILRRTAVETQGPLLLFGLSL